MMNRSSRVLAEELVHGLAKYPRHRHKVLLADAMAVVNTVLGDIMDRVRAPGGRGGVRGGVPGEGGQAWRG